MKFVIGPDRFIVHFNVVFIFIFLFKYAYKYAVKKSSFRVRNPGTESIRTIFLL
jgi:hypothetical protein